METIKIVVFFTNQESSRNIYHPIDFTENKKIDVEDCDACKVYILNDTDEDLPNDFPEDIDGYYVYHSQTNKEVQNKLKKKNIEAREDHHIGSSSIYYIWFREIDLTNDGNFPDTISKELFDKLWGLFSENTKLNKTLVLLHKLLGGELPPSLDSELKEFQIPYETFKKNVDGKNNFDEDYLEALAELRDKMLNNETLTE